MSAAKERDPLALLTAEGIREAMSEQYAAIRKRANRTAHEREALYLLEDLVNDLTELCNGGTHGGDVELRPEGFRPMKREDVAVWLVRARALKERMEKP